MGKLTSKNTCKKKSAEVTHTHQPANTESHDPLQNLYMAHGDKRWRWMATGKMPTHGSEKFLMGSHVSGVILQDWERGFHGLHQFRSIHACISTSCSWAWIIRKRDNCKTTLIFLSLTARLPSFFNCACLPLFSEVRLSVCPRFSTPWAERR
jgi:hypothetical protein